MKTRIIKTILSIGLLVVVSGFVANAQSLKVTGDIPFDFIVGDVAMNAGEYTVGRNYMPEGVLAVRGIENGEGAVRLVQAIQSRTMPNETVLVFNRYIDNGGEVSTFLSQVWIEGDKRGYEFLKHRAERKAADRMARRDIITVVFRVAERPGQ